VLAGFAAVMPFVPLFIKDALGIAAESTLGIWVAAFHFFGTLGYAMFCPIWGALSDRFGVKPMLLRGTFGTAVIFPLMAYAGSAWLLVLLRFLSAACAGTTAASQTLLVKNTPENKQGFALGVLSTAIWGGTMLGNVIGGIVVHHYGYKFTFIACGAMYFVAGFIVLLAHEDFKPAVKSAASKVSGWVHGVPHFTVSVWMILGLMSISGFVRYIEIPYIAMLVEQISGAKEAAYWTGIISGFVAVGALLSGVITGYLSDRVKPVYILIPSLSIVVITLLVQAFARDLWTFGISRTVMYLAGGGVFSVLQKLLSAATPKRKRGAVFGFSTTANSTGIMLSTVAAGAVICVGGVRGVFFTGAILTALLIPACVIVIGRLMQHPYFSFHYRKIMERKK
ncbi:MAG: MFS transporter, partial [Lentisphaeria bacterium]|nr:MFS transporter [Lentisphaeria bacterium]